MIKYAVKLITLIGILLIVFALVGCADSESIPGNEYLIRVEDRVITVHEFNRAFEIAKAAYPHNEMQEPVAIRDARLRLLNQMAEEMVLLERAKELDIKVSDSEAEKAIADIKGEYPEDVFEQMLLEYAVPYHSWEKGFKTRLLMEKVIAKELGKQIAITPAEISNYYHENYKDQSLTSDLKEVPEDISATIIKHLRRKKVEEAYKSWITKLQKKYAIEINKAQWEKIIGS
jgi:hypothetical protein